MLVEKGDLDGARTLFNEAAGIEPYCVEAIYNLGLVNLKLGETQVGAVGLLVGMPGGCDMRHCDVLLTCAYRPRILSACHD